MLRIIKVGAFLRLLLSLGGVCACARLQADASLKLACFHEDLLPGIKAVLPEFEKTTGLKVQALAVPHGSYELWLRTQLLSGDPPDLALLDDLPLISRYGLSGLLQPLEKPLRKPNPFAEPAVEKTWFESFKPDLMQQARDPAGRLWVVPFTQYGVGFFYNRAEYERLDLRPPGTWEELLANFRAVRAGGRTALASAIKANDAQTVWMADMLLELLLRPVAQDVNRLCAPGWHYDAFDPTSTWNEAITLDERLVAFERGLIDPARSRPFRETARLVKELAGEFRPDFLSLDGEEVTRIFARGQAVHFLNGTWYLRELSLMQRSIAQTAPERVFPWAVFPFPELTENSTSLPRLGGITQNSALRVCLLLPRHATAPEREAEAVRLAQFLTAPEVTARLFGNTEVYDLPAVTGVPAKNGVDAIAPPRRYAFLQTAQFRGYDAKGEGEFWTLWQRYLGGTLSLDDFLRALSASHRAALARLASEQGGTLNRKFLETELPGGFEP